MYIYLYPQVILKFLLGENATKKDPDCKMHMLKWKNARYLKKMLESIHEGLYFPQKSCSSTCASSPTALATLWPTFSATWLVWLSCSSWFFSTAAYTAVKQFARHGGACWNYEFSLLCDTHVLRSLHLTKSKMIAGWRSIGILSQLESPCHA